MTAILPNKPTERDSMKLSENEQIRIQRMKQDLAKFKRQGHEVEFWDNAFTLEIIDRLLRSK